MQFSIKAAELGDIAEIAKLFDAYRVFYQQDSDLPSAEIYLKTRFQNHESQIFWAQDEAGRGLGFVQLYPSFSSVSMQRLWILNDLFVSQSARKKGVGEALMERAKLMAIDTGAKGLQLETGQDNHNAQALYEKLGYVKSEDYFVYYLSTPKKPA
ncbi:MAG: GNAT family N-acetyltransferase [Bacteroidia bacterium]